MADFKVIQASPMKQDSISDFEKKVKEMLNDGWKLVNGSFSSQSGSFPVMFAFLVKD